ncbi:hypothetical protein ISS37_08530 [candidate division KSB1 bacterium]|nr:hypothetical protein [candidate division KSB1 bacterium]
MEIREVTSRRELRRFLELPYKLYRNDPYWVPPLRSEQKKMFDGRRNPMLLHCDYAYFVAYDDGELMGRIAVFIDRHANEYWGTKIGSFGSYECVDCTDTSRALLTVARDWLVARGMTTMRGPSPINFEVQNAGFIIEGFDYSPVLMSPYNPPYYNNQMGAFGLTKAKDLEAYAVDMAVWELPERFKRYSQRIKNKYGIRVRTVDPKHLVRDIRIITGLTNRSIDGNWGFSPVTDAEATSIAKEVKRILDPSIVFIVEAKGEPIGYSITFPDINVILKKLNGRLFPFVFFRMLKGIKKINSYRLWALGIVKEYQRRGIDTLLYLRTYEALKPRGARLEANYVLEDNFAMKGALLKLGMELVRKYRVYEMPLE